MREDIIEMTRQELERYQVLGGCLRKEIRQAKAEDLLGLGERHIRRLVKRVRLRGMKGLRHGNRGRTSPRKMGYVDDATGRFYGRYYDHEGIWPAMGQHLQDEPEARYRRAAA